MPTDKVPGKNGMTLPIKYPFKTEVQRILKTTKTANRQGYVASERMTITVEREYLPIPYARIMQDKSMLLDLSPEACKLMIYIALHLGYEEARIKIPQPDTGLSRRLYPRAILELMLKRIIARDKQNWYWVNVALLVVGKVDKQQPFAE